MSKEMDSDERNALAHPIHTLLTREIRPIRDWHQWLAHWQWAEDSQWMESLLHCGFDVPLQDGYREKEYDEIDRLIFYFTIADGWRDSSLLRLAIDGDMEYAVGWDENGMIIRKSPKKLRQQLARKAFDMLCLNFFKKTELKGGGRRGDEFQIYWENKITSKRLFPVIQKFFRIEEIRSGEVTLVNMARNDKGSHNEELAVVFILKLAQFMWDWEEPEIQSWVKGKEREKAEKWNSEMRSRLDNAKPWMVELLVGLNRLDILRKWILELEKPCLAKLEEIAFSNKFSQYCGPVREDRPVFSLDEACYLGSKVAWFLKEHQLMTGEHNRLSEVDEAKRQRDEADRKIKNLTSNK